MLSATINDFIAIVTLLVLVLLIYENSRFASQTKKAMYLTCLYIFTAMAAEWAGLLLNGAPYWTVGIHKIVKCVDYALTPVAGYMVIAQVTNKDQDHNVVRILLWCNGLLQLISIFTGWTFYMDGQNYYHHGSVYPLYVLVYLFILVTVFKEFYTYGKQFKKQNRASLIAIFIIVVSAIILQEVFNYRVTYMMLAIVDVCLFVHYSEFSQLTSDENLLYQKRLLETDPLSGLYSRYAYTDFLKKFQIVNKIPNDFVVFSVDVNDLKRTNDTYGHLAGDELIQGAARCIAKCLSKYGKCYRTGGDEFIAFLYMEESLAYILKTNLVKEASRWHGQKVQELTLSIGYAIAKENPKAGIEELITLADKKMYENKAQFYLQSNRESRINEEIVSEQKEYMDIISAFASDVSGLYVIDREKKEVTAYRISNSDHRIRSGVPLVQEFDVAMERFIENKVHPDDKAMMRQSVKMDFIESELSVKKSFTYHFRTLINGEISFHYMKCMRNIEEEYYDKIIISFCPETAITNTKSVQEILQMGIRPKMCTVLVADEKEEVRKELKNRLGPNFRILFAKTGSEALDILKENYKDISVVLYQQDMNDLSVVPFLEAVQKNVFLYSIPVAILSEERKEAIEQKCFDLGAVDVFSQPFDYVRMRHRVQNIMRMNEISQSLGEIEMDDLTGVYTKQAFYYHAKTLIDASPNESFSIFISNIQNFKMYNVIHGESKGDELLKSIANYIQNVNKTGIVARYGEDQFVSISKSPDEAIIERTFKHMQAQINKEAEENVVLKFGIYENVDRNISVARMCDRAIFALRSIKQNYVRSFAYFDEPVSQRQYRAQMFESRFNEAVENKEFEVWYQPKYNPYTQKVVGAEALVRWAFGDTLIPPSEFLPEFETNGLVCQLDEYVFRKTCEQQRKWKVLGKALIPISVNLSRNSIYQKNIVKRYKAIVEEFDIPIKMVPIEITESAAIENQEIKPLTDEFHEAGFSLEMDDFGAGRSSVSGLSLLHFDTIKLDEKLIRCIGEEQGNLVLNYSVTLGKELGLKVVAEGVETKEQLEYLKDIGCDMIQGYYFSKALPVNSFEQVVAESYKS